MDDFKVKDITQAEFGRKEISIAESEMPGLMALRKLVHHMVSFEPSKSFSEFSFSVVLA